MNLEGGLALYELARTITRSQAQQLIDQAKDDEERKFWQYIYDMNKKRSRNAAVYDIYLNCGVPGGWWNALEPFVNEVLNLGLIRDLYIGENMGRYLVFGPKFHPRATQQERHDLYNKVQEIRHLANAAVSTVCRRCGNPGTPREAGHNTGSVFCDDCYQAPHAADLVFISDREKNWCARRSLPVLRYYFREPPTGFDAGTYCEAYEFISDEPAICYHCEKPIAAGIKAVLLVSIDDDPEEGNKGDHLILHCHLPACPKWRNRYPDFP